MTHILDQYDLRIIAAAKSEGDRLTKVREVWGDRVGISNPDSVPLAPIINRLAAIVEVRKLATLEALINEAAKNQELFFGAQNDASKKIVDAVVRRDYAAAGTALLSRIQSSLIPGPPGSQPTVDSQFQLCWFWTLLNVIQCSPRNLLTNP